MTETSITVFKRAPVQGRNTFVAEIHFSESEMQNASVHVCSNQSSAVVLLHATVVGVIQSYSFLTRVGNLKGCAVGDATHLSGVCRQHNVATLMRVKTVISIPTQLETAVQ